MSNHHHQIATNVENGHKSPLESFMTTLLKQNDIQYIVFDNAATHSHSHHHDHQEQQKKMVSSSFFTSPKKSKSDQTIATTKTTTTLVPPQSPRWGDEIGNGGSRPKRTLSPLFPTRQPSIENFSLTQKVPCCALSPSPRSIASCIATSNTTTTTSSTRRSGGAHNMVSAFPRRPTRQESFEEYDHELDNTKAKNAPWQDRRTVSGGTRRKDTATKAKVKHPNNTSSLPIPSCQQEIVEFPLFGSSLVVGC